MNSETMHVLMQVAGLGDTHEQNSKVFSFRRRRYCAFFLGQSPSSKFSGRCTVRLEFCSWDNCRFEATDRRRIPQRSMSELNPAVEFLKLTKSHKEGTGSLHEPRVGRHQYGGIRTPKARFSWRNLNNLEGLACRPQSKNSLIF